MAKTKKTQTPARKRFIPTQAYFDPTAATLTVVSYNGATLLNRTVPAEVVTAAREEQEQWAREVVRETGRKADARARDYPYGFLFNV